MAAKEMIYNLPSIFNKGQQTDCCIHFYSTTQSSTKNKIILQQNLICFLQLGNKEISYAATTEAIDSSRLFILPTANVLMTEKTTKDGTYKSVLLFFSDHFFLGFLQKHGLKINKTSRSNASITIKKNAYLLHFEQSLDLLAKELSDYELLKIKLEEILLYVFKHHVEQLYPIFKNIQHRSQNLPLIEVVNNNLENHLTIEELAFLCHMSVSTFKRKFLEVFQSTPQKYFIDYKMQKALALLKKNKKPSEIAIALGYETLSAFSSAFKKKFGVSPRAHSV
jgi:AraC-like DNA-binding protein